MRRKKKVHDHPECTERKEKRLTVDISVIDLDSLGEVVAKQAGDLVGELKLLLDLGLVGLVALEIKLGIGSLASGFCWLPKVKTS